MQQSAKYIIHTEVRASGVVERSDVVGAVFGQTEGLLGEDLDLRDLQQSSKVGRIDVNISQSDGRSYGTITIASGLDRVETAVLAASLETIDQVGPCRAECTVSDIADARAAKRREVVDRATELLSQFEESVFIGDTLLEEVRKRARVEAIDEYEGLPAGPRVEDSDAVIVVEGRADVRQLLEYGIKNTVAVEGTDVPDAVVHLTESRTTTAFLDGDRGGDLILRELRQVGEVDYVAFAPAGRSVEDLERSEISQALQKKLPADQIDEGTTARESFEPDSGPGATTDGVEAEQQSGGASAESTGTDAGAVTPAADPETTPAASGADSSVVESVREATVEPESGAPSAGGGRSAESERPTGAPAATDGSAEPSPGPAARAAVSGEESVAEPAVDSAPDTEETTDTSMQSPATLAGHVETIVGDGTGRARLLDAEWTVLAETDAADTFDAIADSETVPTAVVLDGPVTQRLLDIAAQRGVRQVVGASAGDYVKQPTSVRVRTADAIESQPDNTK